MKTLNNSEVLCVSGAGEKSYMAAGATLAVITGSITLPKTLLNLSKNGFSIPQLAVATATSVVIVAAVGALNAWAVSCVDSLMFGDKI